MAEEKLSRKDFFKKIALLSASTSGSLMFLTNCGKPGRPKTDHLEEMADSAKYSHNEMTVIDKSRPEGCKNITELSGQELKVRESHKYTVNSPFKKRYCGNCLHYEAPEPRTGNSCGKCSVVPGPISPGGHCTSWKTEFKS